MKLIYLREQKKEEDQRYRGFYKLTPTGHKIASSLNDSYTVIRNSFLEIPEHETKVKLFRVDHRK